MRVELKSAFALLVLVVGMAQGPVFASEDAEAVAREKAEVLVEEAHRAMTASGTDAEKFDALKGAVSDAFDFDIWERFLLGEIAGSFSDDQRAEFRDLLPGFLSRLYFDQFGKGLEAKPEISEARTVRRDVLVRAAIPRANGKKLPVDWRIRETKDKGPRVIDIMVGGASFLILKRDEFKAVFDQGGSEALLEHVRQNAI